MQDYERLEVWKWAHELAVAVYGETAGYPEAERFGLTAQSRRAAVSVASNIAEGCGRPTKVDLRRFLGIASGSVTELQYQLRLAGDLEYLDAPRVVALTERCRSIRRMLTRLRSRLTDNR